MSSYHMLHAIQPTSIPNNNYLPQIYWGGGGGHVHEAGKVIIIKAHMT